MTAKFQYDTGKYQTVKSVGSMILGDTICKYGKTTNKTCMSVVAVNQRAQYGNVAVAGLAMLKMANGVKEGDSGGPAYKQANSTIAVGIVSGMGAYTDNVKKVCYQVAFIQLASVFRNMGIAIKTG